MGVCPLLILLLGGVLVISEVRSKSITSDTLTPEAPTQVAKVSYCGTPDTEVIGHSEHSRVRRYYFTGTRWDKPVITYRVLNAPTYPYGKNGLYNTLLTKVKVDRLMAEAFQEWAPHCGLRFIPLRSGHADIMVSFESGVHGDERAFDGPSGELAHASLPSDAGVHIHFDDEETWVVDRSRTPRRDAFDFYPTAMHEIGHALGLHHSNNNHSIMYKYSDIEETWTGLHWDDIVGMRKLYNIPIDSYLWFIFSLNDMFVNAYLFR